MITRSELENDFLLNSKQIIVLPAVIDDDTLEMVMAKIVYLRLKDQTGPVSLYCRCDGGDALAGMAIANFIQADGKIVGILIGDTGSSGATVWASCAKRYTFKNARLGLHPVTWNQNSVSYDAAKLHELSVSFEASDRRQCELYAAASRKPFEWWWEYYNRAGDVKWLDAETLVDIGMAQFADE